QGRIHLLCRRANEKLLFINIAESRLNQPVQFSHGPELNILGVLTGKREERFDLLLIFQVSGMLVKNESPETSRAEGLERDRNLQGIILRALGEVGPKIIGSSPDGSCQIPNEREMQHLLGCDEVNL